MSDRSSPCCLVITTSEKPRVVDIRLWIQAVGRLIEQLKYFKDAASVEETERYRTQMEEIKAIAMHGDSAPMGRTYTSQSFA